MSSLFDFLTDVAINPKKQMALAKQPSAVMVAAGLSKTEWTALESKDSHTIAAASLSEMTQPFAICCVDPGPDPEPDPDPPSPPSEPPGEPENKKNLALEFTA
jgi:hypothetical protein